MFINRPGDDSASGHLPLTLSFYELNEFKNAIKEIKLSNLSMDQRKKKSEI